AVGRGNSQPQGSRSGERGSGRCGSTLLVVARHSLRHWRIGLIAPINGLRSRQPSSPCIRSWAFATALSSSASPTIGFRPPPVARSLHSRGWPFFENKYVHAG